MINKKSISITIIAIIVVMQMFGIDKEIPEIDYQKDFIMVTQPPIDVANIIKNSCYDCHSYTTTYPWYASVAPISWFVGHHIEEAREHLNFSTWADYPQKKALHKLEEFYEEVEEGEMPLSSYTIMHSEATLTSEQTESLVTWVKSIPGVLAQ